MNPQMRNATTIVIVILITIIVGLFASIYGTDSSTIVMDGRTYVNTTAGIREYKDVEYLATIKPFTMPKAITTIKPAMLPTTAQPIDTNMVTCQYHGTEVQAHSCNDL